MEPYVHPMEAYEGGTDGLAAGRAAMVGGPLESIRDMLVRWSEIRIWEPPRLWSLLLVVSMTALVVPYLVVDWLVRNQL